MDRISVTENEMLEALRQAMLPKVEGDGTTVQELVQATGRSPQTVRNGLRKMIQAGRAEVVRVSRTRLDGLLNTVSAYRPK